MALNDHLKLTLLIDGVFQVEVSGIDITLDSKAIDVETLQGYAGKTPGAKVLELSYKSAVPIGGLEFNFIDAIANGTYHEVQIPVGSKSIISKGDFRSGTLSGSVGSSTEAGATFRGELNPLE